MELVNAIVDCDVSRLNIPLRPWFPRTGCAYAVVLRRVPSDVSAVTVRVKRQGGVEECEAHPHPDGSWFVVVPPAAFPAEGEFAYSVRGVFSRGLPCAIGEGRVVVEELA